MKNKSQEIEKSKALVSSQSTERTRIESGGLVEAPPDYLKQETESLLGAEAMRPRDVAIARVMLAQPLSQAIDKQNETAYISGLEPGMFYNSLTRENYGSKIFIVPLMSLLKRLRMRSIEEGGGILCRSENGTIGEGEPGGDCRKCSLSKWLNGDRPECDEVLTYHVLCSKSATQSLTPDDWAVWGAKVSAIKAARFLNRLYSLRGPYDLFKGRYELSSFYDRTLKKPCWVPKVENAGWITSEQYKFAKGFFLAVRNLERAGNIRVLDAEVIDEPREPGADD